ncbi:MAG: S-adenosylmethionine decarboxylase [Actinomycetota bacterium]|nr:S-adenosylmethionine decarboxylase [Actinomycetota bacterium]MDA8207481.1 S-adenosylmethionine decarboxylase [Actinomycetota bacterium]
MNSGSAHSLKGEVVDLAPDIYRQRLVIEGVPAAPINDAQIVKYLRDLGTVCGMKVLTDPVTHLSETYGWAGWVHWETSGAHFYAWDTPRLFFSVDVYTCKPFDAAVAAEFTRKALGASVITYREF